MRICVVGTVFTLLKTGLTKPSSFNGLISHLLFNQSNRRSSRTLSQLRSMSSFTAGATNPLLDKESLPKFEEIKVEHVVPALQEDLQQLKTQFKGLSLVEYIITNYVKA